MFQRVSIGQQLQWVIMITTTLALAVAGAVFIVYEFLVFANREQRQLETLARVIADASAAALAFADPTEAQRNLTLLGAEANVRAAALYDANGQLVAEQRAPYAERPTPRRPRRDGSYRQNGQIALFRPVAGGQQRYGTLYILWDLGSMYRAMWLYAGTALLVLAGGLIAALVIGQRLQRTVSEPIQSLAQAARAVAEHNDYSVRPPKHSQDEVGALTDAFNHMLDEIQRRTAELKSAAERLRLAAEATGYGTFDYEPPSGRLVCSENARRHFGLGAEGPVSFEVLWRTVHPEDRPRVETTVAETLRGASGGQYHLEYRTRGLEDGVERWLDARGQVFFDENGRAVRLLGTTLDISERKRSEQALRQAHEELERHVEERTAELAAANRELEAFGYTVSHDLRAPLRHVTSYVRLLEKDLGPNLDARARADLEVIAKAASRMGHLIDDLLTLSRLGRATMLEKQVDLAQILQETRQELAPMMVGRAIQWQVGPLPVVLGDPTLLRAVLTNLVSNALKYTRPRHPARIEIGCEPTEQELICFVRDNGVGFDMAFVDKLFGVFQRLHAAEEFEGSGIGLASVRRAIQRHGGRTWAEGQPERGATIYFALPRSRLVRLPSPGATT